MVPKSVILASLGSLLKIEIVRLHPKSIKSETLGVGLESIV